MNRFSFARPQRKAAGGLVRSVIWAVLVAATMAGSPARAATHVGGEITTNTTWTLAGSPYLLDNTVIVRGGATLTLDPGVVVGPHLGCRVLLIGGGAGDAGSLQAVGTSTEHILFQSVPGDPGAGIRVAFQAGSNGVPSLMEYCDFAGGANCTHQVLEHYETNQPTLRHGSITGSLGIPVLMTDGSPVYEDVSFSGNGGTEMLLGNSSSPSLIDCTFDTGAQRGITLHGSHTGTLTFSGTTFTGTGDFGLTVPAMSVNGGFTTSGYVVGAEVRGGTITADRTWPMLGVNQKYALGGQITVRNGATLTLEPGTIVGVGPSGGCPVLLIGGGAGDAGSLQAVGTSTEHILFQSVPGDPGAGIRVAFQAGSNGVPSLMEYCDFAGGANCTHQVLEHYETNQPTLRHGSITGSLGIPVLMTDGSPVYEDVSFSGNGGTEMLLGNSSSPSLIDCTFDTGAQRGITLHGSHTGTLTFSGTTFTGTGDFGLTVPAMSVNGGFTTSGYVVGAEVRGGTITADRTWPMLGVNQKYALGGQITVRNGATLTLEPGTIVAPWAGCRVLLIGGGAGDAGSLQAMGTSTEHILFQSVPGDPGAGIRVAFQAGSNGVPSLMEYCDFAGGANCTHQVLEHYETNQPTLRHGSITGSLGNPVVMNDGSPVYEDVSFSGNGGPEVYVANSASPSLIDCTFDTGAHKGFSFDGGHTGTPTFSGTTFTGTGPYAMSMAARIINGGFTTSGYSVGVEVVAPNLTTSRHWTALGPSQAYAVPSMDIHGGATLTLDPGVVIKGKSCITITVGGAPTDGGSLQAIGTAEQHIVFTSLDGAVGGWGGLAFEDGSDFTGHASRLEFCEVMNGGGCTAGQVTMGTTSGVTIDHCSLTSSASYAVSAGSSTAVVSQSSILGNLHGIGANSSSSIDARNCWWGDITGPKDLSAGPPDHNPGGLGQDVTDYVTYRDWLISPPCLTSRTIAASAGANGSIAPSGAVTAWCGTNRTFTITPGACHHVADVLVDGASVGALTSYTFTDVQTAHTIAASFALNTYAITASAGPNGSISSPGVTQVGCGASQEYTITPAACYQVYRVTVDGLDVGAVTSYTLTNVTAPHTISATFAPAVAAVPPRMQAWWAFDVGSIPTQIPDLVHGLSGINPGSAPGSSISPNGRVGGALPCPAWNTGMRVDVKDGTLTFNTTGFGIDAWIHLYPGSPAGAQRMIMARGDAGIGAPFQFYVRDGQLVFELDHRSGFVFQTTGAPLTESVWHHVALTAVPQQGRLKLYVDGAEAASLVRGPFSVAHSTQMWVGRFPPSYGFSGPDYAFNGLIDEVDLFIPSSDNSNLAAIQAIWQAGCAGKRREFVRVPATQSLCENRGSRVGGLIANMTRSPQTYDWRVFQKPGCPAPTLSFTQASGTVTIPAYQTQNAYGSVEDPGLEYVSTCITLEAVNVATGSSISGDAAIRGVAFCEPAPSPTVLVLSPASSLDGETPTLLTGTMNFVLLNGSGSAAVVPYRLDAIRGDDLTASEVVSLDGLPPGTPVEQSVMIAAGDSATISVNLSVDFNSPFLMDQVRLWVDLDGDSVIEPLIARLVEASEDTVGVPLAVDPGQASRSLRFVVSPNPFRSRMTVAFTIPTPRAVRVGVYDVTGRLVRGLHEGIAAAGTHDLSWDGRDAVGHRSGPGIYFVRVDSEGARLSTKVVQIR